jgi:hydrogenase maturation protein HypF
LASRRRQRESVSWSTGVARPSSRRGFTTTLIAATADRVRAAIAAHGRVPIVLTGGAFANPRLAQGLVRALSGLDVRLHGDVPPGDGGIALGQALVADAIARR